MTSRKTQETDASVAAFLGAVKNKTRRQDSYVVSELLQTVTGHEPRMWGASIVGFGKHHYTYANGRPAEICRIGFAPRAQSLVFYLGAFDGRSELLAKLGKHRLGQGGCLYINKLADVDLQVLNMIFESAYRSGASEQGEPPT